MDGRWSDVHGAGSQRSDPKSGDPAEFPTGHGPQGDAIRIDNSVRLVRAGDQGVQAMLDTGQSACYNSDGEAIACPTQGEAFYGQDAQYTGSAFNFTDNGDGTITDHVTQLRWQQTPSSDKYGWAEAQTYCENLSLADNDHWRTPSLKELFSISDFERGWPYIDSDYFGLITGGKDKSEQYWSSNYYKVGKTHGDAPSAIGVNHTTGHIKAYPDGSNGSPRAGKYVRCVQGNDYLINDFVDNGDGTITDKATGLMWLQNDSGAGMDWASALSYGQTFSYAGYDDWRVPNVKELQSIVDYSGVYPAINARYFNTTDDDAYFWSSTSAYFSPQNPDYYYGWYVAFGYAVGGDGEDVHGAGAVRFDTKVEGGPAGEDPERIYNYVRLVRGGTTGRVFTGGTVTEVDTDTGNTADTNNPDPSGQPTDGNAPPTGNIPEPPDLTAAAATLGVSEEDLKAALGDPHQGQPDFEAAATILGVTSEALQAALAPAEGSASDEPST